MQLPAVAIKIAVKTNDTNTQHRHNKQTKRCVRSLNHISYTNDANQIDSQMANEFLGEMDGERN